MPGYCAGNRLLAICNGPVGAPPIVCEQVFGPSQASVNWRCAVEWPLVQENNSQPLHRRVVEPTGESMVRLKNCGPTFCARPMSQPSAINATATSSRTAMRVMCPHGRELLCLFTPPPRCRFSQSGARPVLVSPVSNRWRDDLAGRAVAPIVAPFRPGGR
jgi:hypothetical protein